MSLSRMATVIGAASIMVAGAGAVAYAGDNSGGSITSAQIRDNTIVSADIHNATLTQADVRMGTFDWELLRHSGAIASKSWVSNHFAPKIATGPTSGGAADDDDSAYAKKSEVYTRDQADAKFAEQGSSYTKAQADEKFLTQDQADQRYAAKDSSGGGTGGSSSGGLSGYTVKNTEVRLTDTTGNAEVSCGDGLVATGGGFAAESIRGGTYQVSASAPVYDNGKATGWVVTATATGNVNLKSWVICASEATAQPTQ